jgi:hypothetical protein
MASDHITNPDEMNTCAGAHHDLVADSTAEKRCFTVPLIERN